MIIIIARQKRNARDQIIPGDQQPNITELASLHTATSQKHVQQRHNSLASVEENMNKRKILPTKTELRSDDPNSVCHGNASHGQPA